MLYASWFLCCRIGIEIALKVDMAKVKNVDLVRYEYIVYINLLDTDNIKEILITLDDYVDPVTENFQIKWTPVRNLNIDIVDIGTDDASSSDSECTNRICGLFDAEPLDWKYARILVDNKSRTKDNYAIAKMPISPITPIMFEIK